MWRPLGRPSRIKDALGVLFLLGTAWLYAVGTAGGEGGPCGTCDDPNVVPATAPEPPPPPVAESVLSVQVGDDAHPDEVEVRGG